jgi:hypothetical protein
MRIYRFEAKMADLINSPRMEGRNRSALSHFGY